MYYRDKINSRWIFCDEELLRCVVSKISNTWEIIDSKLYIRKNNYILDLIYADCSNSDEFDYICVGITDRRTLNRIEETFYLDSYDIDIEQVDDCVNID